MFFMVSKETFQNKRFINILKMFNLKHFFNISTQIFEKCFLWDTEKKIQNKCLLDVYIESVKKCFNINVF